MSPARVLRAAVAALALASWPPVASAQRVQPMVFDLAPSGEGATTTLRVENTRSAPVTVEITASAIAVDAAGVETLTPADGDFLIFPPQSIIPPGRTQAFRVRYVGEPRLERSRSYRVAVRQVPVQLAQGESGIVVAVNFQTLANVVPAGAEAELAVLSVAPGSEAGTLTVELENRGTRYARLTRTTWTFQEPSGATLTAAGRDLFAGRGGNLAPPGQRRSVSFRPPEGVTPGATVTVATSPGG